MLIALDHIVLLCRDFETAKSEYTALFGVPPDWLSKNDHTQSALFRTGNTGFEILAPTHGSDAASRFEEILGGNDGVLTSLAFATDDIENAHHVLARRGLSPSDISDGQSVNLISRSERNWRRLRCSDNSCAGIKTFVLQNGSEHPPITVPNGLALDHLVINTPNPERTIAHYGGRLGLRFALDRTIEDFQTRFLFFRIGGLTLEIIYKLDEPHDAADLDSIWGLTWKVDDLKAAHRRLKDADVHLSDIRTGRKPGSQVFTVKSHSTGIPTLFIAHEKRGLNR